MAYALNPNKMPTVHIFYTKVHQNNKLSTQLRDSDFVKFLASEEQACLLSASGCIGVEKSDVDNRSWVAGARAQKLSIKRRAPSYEVDEYLVSQSRSRF